MVFLILTVCFVIVRIRGIYLSDIIVIVNFFYTKKMENAMCISSFLSSQV